MWSCGSRLGEGIHLSCASSHVCAWNEVWTWTTLKIIRDDLPETVKSTFDGRADNPRTMIFSIQASVWNSCLEFRLLKQTFKYLLDSSLGKFNVHSIYSFTSDIYTGRAELLLFQKFHSIAKPSSNALWLTTSTFHMIQIVNVTNVFNLNSQLWGLQSNAPVNQLPCDTHVFMFRMFSSTCDPCSLLFSLLENI